MCQCDPVYDGKMLCVRGFGISLVSLISVLAVESGCNYKAKVIKSGPCASNKDPVATLENFDMKLSDNDCGLQIMGCVKVMKDVTDMTVQYKGYKDGLPVISGSKKACGFKEDKFEIKCPLKKGQKICPGDSVIPLPGGAKTAGMAKGNLKATVEVVADGKKYCYEGTATVTSA